MPTRYLDPKVDLAFKFVEHADIFFFVGAHPVGDGLAIAVCAKSLTGLGSRK